MKVLKNTYPVSPGVPHAEIGDVVHWESIRNSMNLVRDLDNQTVFTIGPIRSDGALYSTKKAPVLIGIIAQIKSRGFVLEVSK